MDRRQFIKLAGAGVAVSMFGHNPASAHPKGKPNIMLVIGDDMTWHDCEPYGSENVRTPNMGRLAAEGMCLDGMFTSTAMCAPTRQQLYTGLWPVRSGAYPNHSKVYEGVKSICHYLGDLGYRVGLIGKRHFGPQESFPFEHLGGRHHDGGKGKEFLYERIEEFVGRDERQPCCLIVASNQPHGPWNRGDQTAYDPDKLTVPPYMVDCPETRDALVRYYAEITYLDDQVGECMRIVDASGQKDGTMLIFTSEQGASLPAGGKWTCYDTGLKTAFIVRWPDRVRPGSRSDALTQYVDVVPTLIEAAGGDPRLVDVGRPDAHGDEGFDGRSFLDVLTGRTNTHRDYVYGAQTTRGIIRGSACYPIRSVRSARYKYIRNLNHESPFYNLLSTGDRTLLAKWAEYGKSDPAVAALARRYKHRPAEELYDVRNDPFEMHNLANDPAIAQVKARLAGELDRWMKQQGDRGVDTEMKAIERQGPNRKWQPYNPNRR